MWDDYEQNAFERIKVARFLASDALARADDGLTPGRFEMDKFDYALTQVKRATTYLTEIVEECLKMAHRREQIVKAALPAAPGPEKKTKGHKPSGAAYG